MNAVNMTSGNAGAMDKRSGILYPLMLIAAMAVIVLSISGIATMMGWMPGVLSRGEREAVTRGAVSCRTS